MEDNQNATENFLQAIKELDNALERYEQLLLLSKEPLKSQKTTDETYTFCKELKKALHSVASESPPAIENTELIQSYKDKTEEYSRKLNEKSDEIFNKTMPKGWQKSDEFVQFKKWENEIHKNQETHEKGLDVSSQGSTATNSSLSSKEGLDPNNFGFEDIYLETDHLKEGTNPSHDNEESSLYGKMLSNFKKTNKTNITSRGR